MTRPGTPTAVALLALGLGVLAAPDLGLLGRHTMVRALAAGLVAVLVFALADRRTPRRLVAVGVALAAVALGYDALRGERGAMTVAPGRPTLTFEAEGPGGRVDAHRLAEPVVLESVEPDGTAVLAEGAAARRVRVSRTRAADLAAHRVGSPRRVAGATREGVPGEQVELTVAREPAALLAFLGLLIAMVAVAWSRW